MNIRDLITMLEEIAEESPEAEVRIAEQPSWPFENEINGVVEVVLDDERYEDGVSEPPVVVYLEEGEQIGYLPTLAKEALGW